MIVPRVAFLRVELAIDEGSARVLFAEAPRVACLPGPRLVPVIQAEDGAEHIDPAGVCRVKLGAAVDEHPGAALRAAAAFFGQADRLRAGGAQRRAAIRRALASALVALALEGGGRP
jgi:hypothetical protein